MTDYNWYSSEAVAVAVEGLRSEAKTWHAFSDTASTISHKIADLRIEPTAFFVPDPIKGAPDSLYLSQIYTQVQQWLVTLFGQAKDEFNAFGDALLKCADSYQNSDAESAQDFDQIAKS